MNLKKHTATTTIQDRRHHGKLYYSPNTKLQAIVGNLPERKQVTVIITSALDMKAVLMKGEAC